MVEQSFKGRVEGFSVKTVDTTGAGDAFVGALLLQFAKDPSIFQVFKYNHVWYLTFSKNINYFHSFLSFL